MSYLGNIEEEFSQMAITNRSVITDTPAGNSASRMGHGAFASNALDESSFMGSQAGEEP